RYPRRTGVPGGLVCRAIQVDLLALQLVELGAGSLGEQRRAHHVEPLATGLLGGGARSGSPPDVIAQCLRPRLDRQVAPLTDLLRVALGDAGTVDRLQEQVELVTGEIGTARILRSDVPECLVAAQRGLG